MDFEKLSNKYLVEFTAADAGVGSQAEGEYTSDDTYAPDDSRIPNVLGTTITRDLSSGKAKRKKKKDTVAESKTIHDYLLMPPVGEDQENIVNYIAQLKNSDDEVYRGMSTAEYKNIIKHGKAVSRGAGNTREGKFSYVSKDVQLAGRFAFTEYKQKGRALLLILDKDKLPNLASADPGNYRTDYIPAEAVKKIIDLKHIAKV
jgi:hypothetical protein